MKTGINKQYSLMLLAGILFLTGFSFSAGAAGITEKPNILLIITDQQTADAMSCVGNPHLQTPAMDRIAGSGVLFTRNYVTQPLCLPFRSSLQTGRYPHEIGTVNNGVDIKGEFPMLGNLMAAAGYKCDYIGKWHVGTTPEAAGYPEYDNVGKDDKKTEATIQYLKRTHSKPFFLTVSLMNPHNVCELARADADGTDLPDGPIGLPPVDSGLLPPLPKNFPIPVDEPSVLREVQKKSFKQYPTTNWNELIWRQYLWGYYRLVEKVDREIGEILDALAEAGLEKNTLVLFTSDHGEGIAMHQWNQKQVLYDQTTRVPLVISWKGTTQKSVFGGLVSNALDIPVTLLDIAGVKKPDGMHGKSLVPVIYGKKPETRDYVVTETMFAEGAKELGATGRMIRTGKFKYIVYDNGKNREQLFDMENDPGEMNNLAKNSSFAKELKKHRKLLVQWGTKTKDNFPYVQP